MPNIDALLEEILSDDGIRRVDDLLIDLHPSEIAQLLSSTPASERMVVWNNLSTEIMADVVTELSEDIRVGLLEQTNIHQLVAATTHLDLDDLTDLLQDLPDRLGDIILQSMERQNRRQIEKVLSYPEDTAGGLMNLDAIKIRADVNIDTVHRYIRKLGHLPVTTDKLMVVDRDGLFVGTLQIGMILTHEPEQKVGELMNTESVVIRVDMSDAEVANLFQQRDLISAPVVDERNLLLGRITVDDVLDVLQEEAGQAMMSRDGLIEEDDIFSPAVITTKRRSVWLGVHLIAALISAYIIGIFENDIKTFIELAVLMPLIASMSGVAGSQTLTLTIRGLALNHIKRANYRWLLVKESTAGIMNGLIWGVLIALIAWAWFESLQLALVVWLTILFNLTLSAGLGISIPLIQKKMCIDPALAGHVVLIALTDAIGFLSFLALASWVLI